MSAADEPAARLFAPDRVAVITGAASGIGRAAADAFARLGMRLVLCDQDEAGLDSLAGTLDADRTRIVVGNVSRLADVEGLREVAYDSFGVVDVLMNNAAIAGAASDNWAGLDAWHQVIDVNLWGVVHGVHAFAPAMLRQATRSAIINTGSKQGITNPPGSPAYAVAKAGVKVLTEQLAHGLREAGGAVTAHLLVPGWTFTGMTNAPDGRQPQGSWTAAEVVDRMIGAVERGDFYVICPDGVVSAELDAARIRWAAEDMIENRPALSRWHPEWADRFAEHLRRD